MVKGSHLLLSWNTQLYEWERFGLDDKKCTVCVVCKCAGLCTCACVCVCTCVCVCVCLCAYICDCIQCTMCSMCLPSPWHILFVVHIYCSTAELALFGFRREDLTLYVASDMKEPVEVDLWPGALTSVRRRWNRVGRWRTGPWGPGPDGDPASSGSDVRSLQ